MGKTLERVIAYAQLCFVCGCVLYSTYSLFLGRFEQAFLPYPVLILIYLLFLRRTRRLDTDSEASDADDPSDR